MGSGRLPTHIFLLDSLSLLRNQVLPNLDIHWFILVSFQTSKEPSSSRSENGSVSEQANALEANLSALASRGSVSARYFQLTCTLPQPILNLPLPLN